jgi:caffeoyl-CoA O-methyltransferase
MIAANLQPLSVECVHMKSGRIGLVSIVALVGLAMNGAVAADAPYGTPEGRERFLREFRRTGLSSTPGDAMMLRILVQSAGAKRGVEVGTFTGYGAIHMGIGFERTGGKLVTVELNAESARKARENLAATGLDQTVEVITGDALKVLGELEGEFDFVFIDAHKPDYLKYFRALEPKLKPGAMVVADNVIQSAAAMRDYLEFMEKSPDWETVIIRASEEKDDGMAISYRVK